MRIDATPREQRPLAVGFDVPSTAEAQALIDSDGRTDRPRLLLLIFAGLRASELRALQWRHIDFERRLVSVQQRADWWGELGAPKTRNGYREVPLPPLALNTLRAWRLETPDPSGAEALVFPGKNGRPLNHSSLQESFDRAQSAAAIIGEDGKPKYGLHALRHFYASWRIASGTPPKRLQQVLGHGSIRMTYDVYGHWLGDLEGEHLRLADDEAALVSAC